MQPVRGVIVALLSLFAAIPALAGAAGNESEPGLDSRPIEHDRQEAVAREHWRLYEEWVRQSRKREAELGREDDVAGSPATTETKPD